MRTLLFLYFGRRGQSGNELPCVLYWKLPPSFLYFFPLAVAKCKDHARLFDGLQVIDIFREKNIPPDKTMFTNMITLYTKLGKFQVAINVFHEQKQSSVPIDEITRTVLIEPFAR